MPETAELEDDLDTDITKLCQENEENKKLLLPNYNLLPAETLNKTKEIPIDYLDLITLEKFWNERREQFIKKIFPQFFVPSLIKFNVFDKNDEENFTQFSEILENLEEPSARTRTYTSLNEWIFDQLLCKFQKNPKIICNIIESLRHDNWYPELADEWESHLKDKCKQVYLQSCYVGTLDGPERQKRINNLINFPEPIAYCVDRESKRSEISSYLYAMSNCGKGWLVIYGLRGSGKTVLAESSIRKLENYPFPDGIFWIPIGNLNKDDMFDQALYSKLEILFDSVNYYYEKCCGKPDKLENIKLSLKLHFQDYCKSLIVLDDVQSLGTLEHFNFGVPVLVTTIDRGLIPLELLNLKFVSTEDTDGNILSVTESMVLMKKCLNPKIDYKYLKNSIYLPRIIKEVNGFPYCIPLIANYIIPLVENYSIYNEKNFEKLETFWQQLLEMISESDWINSLLDITIQKMEQQLIDCFYDFSIFPEQVSSSVLQTLWGYKSLITISNLEKLAQKSLIKTHMRNDIKLFAIHELTANYLLKKLGKEKLKERHSKLVDAYLNKYCLVPNEESSELLYDFSKLPEDEYIYRCFSYHIYSSERYDLFPKIFLNLNFLKNKIRSVGQSHVLSDYHYFGQYFHEDKEKMEDFRKFFASNTDICDPSVDLFQVALCQSNSSIIYAEAAHTIKSNLNFYFDWCNKENFLLENQYKKISFKCKMGAKYAALSPDSKNIISVNGDCALHLWDANTVELLSIEKYHNFQINHCTFSHDGQYILTSSDDGKAILWMLCKPIHNSNSGNYYFDRRKQISGNSPRLNAYKIYAPNSSKLKSDTERVNSCSLKYGDISPKNHYVLLGSSTGFIYLFSLKDGKQLFSSPNEDDFENEVTCCSFSPDSRHFLFSVSNMVYVYMIYDDLNNNKSFNVTFNTKLDHQFVIHNAVFDTIINSKKIIIFTSSYASILQWSFTKSYRFSDIKKKKITEENVTCRYILPGNGIGYISICTVSHDGKRIAGFEITRNEIYLWNRRKVQSYCYFHTLSPLVILNFSKTDNCLFSLNSKHEVTLWDLKEANAVTSIIDLTDTFSVTLNKNDSILNVLTIDKKGFLRLFKHACGAEDKDFKEILKKKLVEYFSNEDECSLQLKFNILCCDISALGFSIFCTDVGCVFFYNHSNFSLLSYRQSPEEIIQCRFIPDDETKYEKKIRFVTMCRNKIYLYHVSSEFDELINYYQMPNLKQIDSLHFLSSKIMLIWSKTSDFYFFDCELLSLIEYVCFQSQITSVHSCPIKNEYWIAISFTQNRLKVIKFCDSSIHLMSSLSLGLEIPRCCKICSSYIVFGCDSGNICIVSSESLEMEYGVIPNLSIAPLCIQQHSNSSWISQLAISPDERFILSAADSIKLWLYNDNNCILLQTFITHGNVSQMFVHFPFLQHECKKHIDLQNYGNHDSDEEDYEDYDHHIRDQQREKHENLDITVVTITNTKSLYILKNYRREKNLIAQQID